MEITLHPVPVFGPHVEITHGTTQTWVYDPLVADVTAGIYKAKITLRPDMNTGVFGVAALEVSPPAPASLLRALGMGKAVEEIVLRGSTRFHWDDDVKDWVHDVDSGEDAMTPVDARRALSRGRKRIPDEQVARAAEIYRTALAAGGQTARRATATVATELGISVSAAGVRVRLARERGLLGPAAGTKAGEAT